MVIDVKTGFCLVLLFLKLLVCTYKGTSSFMTSALDALVFVKVCNLWWVSDKVPQGRGVVSVQLLSRITPDYLIRMSNLQISHQTLLHRVPLHQVLPHLAPQPAVLCWAFLWVSLWLTLGRVPLETAPFWQVLGLVNLWLIWEKCLSLSILWKAFLWVSL